MSQIMFLLHVASVALLLALASGYAVADESSECPNWYHRPGSHHCQCGTTLQGGIIVCSDDGMYIHLHFTMTWDSATNQTVAALSNYGYVNYSAITNRVYTLMPNDATVMFSTSTIVYTYIYIYIYIHTYMYMYTCMGYGLSVAA